MKQSQLHQICASLGEPYTPRPPEVEERAVSGFVLGLLDLLARHRQGMPPADDQLHRVQALYRQWRHGSGKPALGEWKRAAEAALKTAEAGIDPTAHAVWGAAAAQAGLSERFLGNMMAVAENATQATVSNAQKQMLLYYLDEAELVPPVSVDF